jgi:hypothetical protein
MSLLKKQKRAGRTYVRGVVTRVDYNGFNVGVMAADKRTLRKFFAHHFPSHRFDPKLCTKYVIAKAIPRKRKGDES